MSNYHKGFNTDTYIRRARKERSLAFWKLLSGTHRAEVKDKSQK